MQSLSTPTLLPISVWLSQLTQLLKRVLRGVQRIGWLIPPSGLVILSSFAMQAGNAGTKMLFDRIGVIGAVFLCKMVASAILLMMHRPRLREYSWQEYRLVAAMGLAISGTVIAFFEAVARVPLGVASTIEFIGPLGLAVAGSRRKVDWLLILFAAIGVFLLSPINNLVLDWLGMSCALLSAAGWASYIVLSKQVGIVFPGETGLALAVTIAAVVIMPLGVGQAGVALLQPEVLLLGAGAGILGTVIPLSLEFNVIKRVPPRVFGVLMSIEPAISALVGLLFLSEHLNLQSVIAILLVSFASAGVTLFGSSNAKWL